MCIRDRYMGISVKFEPFKIDGLEMSSVKYYLTVAPDSISSDFVRKCGQLVKVPWFKGKAQYLLKCSPAQSECIDDVELSSNHLTNSTPTYFSVRAEIWDPESGQAFIREYSVIKMTSSGLMGTEVDSKSSRSWMLWASVVAVLIALVACYLLRRRERRKQGKSELSRRKNSDKESSFGWEHQVLKQSKADQFRMRALSPICLYIQLRHLEMQFKCMSSQNLRCNIYDSKQMLSLIHI
eukprot:TRINITY_DN10720_c0_g1_i1.p1 TRINITY_DN10720_c0_g1~~TRINITY_DN10720_c0_g1_i1.p1  ORF type:complete len:257 (-),score=30.77 TRINITY_DN10720_c0_g1_i1:59-772(-)